MCRLVPALVAQMGDAFPELKAQQTIVEKVIKEEEEAFLRTLDKGIKLIEGIIKNNAETKLVSGKDAFVLYDTFGFPIDLTELIAKENGYTVDLKGFEAELQQQKERSRNATAVEEGDWVEVNPYVATEFTGYDSIVEDGVKLLKYRTVKSKNKESVQLVFDRSPFYAESGGQVGDCGWIEYENGEKIEIVNTVKENGLPVHIATTVPSNPQATFTARIDAARREAVTNNHTATHLLHKALRETLGLHIEQKGSSVTATGFRFDFSHFEKIDPATLRTVEKLVNKYIRENRPRNEFRNMPIEEAKEKGAMALFGEKYGDTVRVIQYGDSIELCGGTHVAATGQIGFFKIVSEGAVAAGIRRIEATTGVHAEDLLYTVEDLLGQIKSYFNNTPNVAASIKKLIADNDALKKSAEEFMKERAISLKDALIKNAQEINGYHVLGMKGNFGAELVKNIAFLAKQECTNTIMIAATEHEGKPTLTLMYTDDLVAKGANAGKDIREAAKFIMGGGGGQPGLATAGGKNTAGLDEAYNKLIEIATK